MAFEPNPISLAEIGKRLPECAYLTLMDVALGASESTASFVVNPEHSQTSHLQFGHSPESSTQVVIPVKASTGDQVCARTSRLPSLPNVIKIDVEGFEDDVLLGLQSTLSSPSLRAVLLEVHFQALQDRGRLTAPVEIAKLGIQA